MSAGSRLELELDLLDAGSELGEDVDADFGRLLLSPFARDDATAGLLHARWGVTLARRGRAEEAAMHFDDASRRWRAAGDGEDEVAEAVLSADAAAQLLGIGRHLDQSERIAVAELRGRTTTLAVTAARKESEGLRAWLAKRGYDARRALTIAWSLHRRGGHLGGCMRLAGTLQELFKQANSPEEELTWAIRAGHQLAAREAASRAGWPAVPSRLMIDAASWEQGASFEAVAGTGTLASDEQVRALVDPLLEVARDHETRERWAVAPPAAARRALAALLSAVDEHQFDAALTEVLFEVETSGFPPRDAVQGLIFATDANRTDQTRLIADIFTLYDRAHVPGFASALQLISRSHEAQEHVVEHASKGFTALVLAAWLDLPDRHLQLRTRMAELVARDLIGDLGSEEMLRFNDRGRVARWASATDQAQIARSLVDTLGELSDLGAHRYEAGEGLASLAERLEPDTAGRTLDRLLEREEAVATPSTTTGGQSHPNRFFARAVMNAPPATGQVRAIALRAACSLAARCDRLPELRETVEQTISEDGPAQRLTALRLCLEREEFLDPDLRQFLPDPDPGIRSMALAALTERGEIRDGDPALLSACEPEQPLELRCAVLGIARQTPADFVATMKLLSRDPHVYVRAVARAALGTAEPG